MKIQLTSSINKLEEDRLEATRNLDLYKEKVLEIINKTNKLGARTLGARSRGSKNVTYRQQTTDKKVNTEPL